MNCRIVNFRARRNGVALIMVLVFIAIGLAALAGVMGWSSLVATNSDRYNNSLAGIAATDAALEKAGGKMIRDFQANDRTYVANHLSDYVGLIPTASENAVMANFQFTDRSHHVNQISIDRIADWGFGDLATKFDGLTGYSTTYKLSGSVTDLSAPRQVPVTVQQNLQLAAIPLFGFALFYNIDLELCPSGTITIGGRAHGNGNIYTEPAGSLTFSTHVTASGNIISHKSPDDPTLRTMGPVVYNGEREDRVTSFILPVGTNNSSTVLHKIIEVPPSGESAATLLGKQRFYNKADLVIHVTTNGVLATSGSYNNFSTAVPNLVSNGMVSTNGSFFDKREYLTVSPIDINIAQLIANYTPLTTALGRQPLTLYISDERPFASSTLGAVRVLNGSTLPAAGLTIATHRPLYIFGNYNVPSGYAGTTNTALCAPASLVADAVSILSGGWADGNSGGSLSGRIAQNMTIKAAIITGIVPSGNGFYSGGLENVFRFLENWSSKTITYNGSIVVLYESHEGVAPWGGSDVYNPPTRKYSWDSKFKQENLWPPGMPFISAAFRTAWNSLALADL